MDITCQQAVQNQVVWTGKFDVLLYMLWAFEERKL